MSARYLNNFSRYLVLSLCLHGLLTLGMFQFMLTAAAPELSSPTPVSVSLTAPALAPLTPHLNQRPPLRQRIHGSARAQTATQPAMSAPATVPLTIANAAWPTLANAKAPLSHRAPPNRRVPVERLSAPAAKTPAAVPPALTSHPTPSRQPLAVQSATASASPSGSNRRRRLARRQTTGNPFPQFIYQPKPNYPIVARRRGWQGTVTLTIEMLSDGTVEIIKVATSSGYPALDTAAQKAVRKWRHRPLQRNGMPITRQANLPIRFRLD